MIVQSLSILQFQQINVSQCVLVESLLISAAVAAMLLSCKNTPHQKFLNWFAGVCSAEVAATLFVDAMAESRLTGFATKAFVAVLWCFGAKLLFRNAREKATVAVIYRTGGLSSLCSCNICTSDVTQSFIFVLPRVYMSSDSQSFADESHLP